jgi:hypothetical protein
MIVIVVIAPATSWGPNRGFRHAVIPGQTRALCGILVENWYEDGETTDGVPFEQGRIGCRRCIRAHAARSGQP